MTAGYWEESVALAFDAIDRYSVWASLSADEQKQIGESLDGSHENYGLAHYSPPASDRIASIEREWSQRLQEERDRTDAVRAGAEKAMRRALRLNSSTPIGITDGGEVYAYGGRTKRIL